ncbi:MAG: NADH-quinone oxidoreductase subunit NuoK [Deltaproteobacteria bacterium]|nr:NADH-quinone oxidoreductase subunit NuoK [Deltaproteobacteria bacterium]
MLDVGLTHYLTVAAILFGFGFLTLMTRRNAVGILLGVELILNAAGLNFVAFSHYVTGGVAGQVFTVFIIILAASEAAIGLAVVLQVYKHYRTIDAGMVSRLRQ